MKQYITLQLFKSFEKVNFYTFKFEDSEQTETDKFFSKFEGNEFMIESVYNLTQSLIEIGQIEGAKLSFFRLESSAQALPPPISIWAGGIRNNLRLYCVRVNKEIVILGNGGIKSSQKAQDSAELMPYFRFINSMSKQITELIKDGDFIFQGKNILNLNEIELIY